MSHYAAELQDLDLDPNKTLSYCTVHNKAEFDAIIHSKCVRYMRLKKNNNISTWWFAKNFELGIYY